MKGKRKMGIILMLICLMLFCQPVWAQENSTPITVTVPKQPEDVIEAAAGAATLKDVPLPQGWEWKDGSISLEPGGSVTGIAVYRDKDGSTLVEREIIVVAPEERNTKYEPISGDDSVWNGDADVGISRRVPEDVGKITTVTKDTASGIGQSTGVKTGDETDVVSWIVVMSLSLGIMLAIGIRWQRKVKRQ